MADQHSWQSKDEHGTALRETTIVRTLDWGRARDEKLAHLRRIIDPGLSSPGLVTLEELQRLLNNRDFCQILYDLFNESGDQPLEQSLLFEKFKTWTEVGCSSDFSE